MRVEGDWVVPLTSACSARIGGCALESGNGSSRRVRGIPRRPIASSLRRCRQIAAEETGYNPNDSPLGIVLHDGTDHVLAVRYSNQWAADVNSFPPDGLCDSAKRQRASMESAFAVGSENSARPALLTARDLGSGLTRSVTSSPRPSYSFPLAYCTCFCSRSLRVSGVISSSAYPSLVLGSTIFSSPISWWALWFYQVVLSVVGPIDHVVFGRCSRCGLCLHGLHERASPPDVAVSCRSIACHDLGARVAGKVLVASVHALYIRDGDRNSEDNAGRYPEEDSGAGFVCAGILFLSVNLLQGTLVSPFLPFSSAVAE